MTRKRSEVQSLVRAPMLTHTMKTPLSYAIYADRNFIAVNKPAGMLVHPARAGQTGFSPILSEELLKHYPELRGVGEDPLRPGIVHRLDRDTSGVLIVARTQAAFRHLKTLFQKRLVEKTYLALVIGIPKAREGMIDSPIGRAYRNPTKRATTVALGSARKTRGMLRAARTAYRVRERFLRVAVPDCRETAFALVEFCPETGRTHQIRVHAAAIGHPLVCDSTYAGKRLCCPFELSRHFLHAAAIELTAPDQNRLRIEADLPEDLTTTLQELRARA